MIISRPKPVASVSTQAIVRTLSDDNPSTLVYDLSLLQERIDQLQTALPEFTHSYAIKAAPYRRLLDVFVRNGMGLEAASYPEVLLAHAVGAHPILFDSPAKTRSEIVKAHRLGAILSANSIDEVHRIHESILIDDGTVGLRINPKVGKGTIAMTSVSDHRSRFGEPFDQVPGDLAVSGLHVHVGSQGYSIEQLCTGVQRLVETAQRLPQITWLDLGGGLPVGENFASYANALRNAVPLLFSGRWKVFTEMGRSLIASCGTVYSRVEYVKNDVATIHLGADFMLRRAYRPEDWQYKITVLTPDAEEKEGPVTLQTIAGPLCFAGDILATELFPTIAVGDIIAIHEVGAYTTSLWSRHCSRRMPPVIGLLDDPGTPSHGPTVILIKQGESDEDVVKIWS